MDNSNGITLTMDYTVFMNSGSSPQQPKLKFRFLLKIKSSR